MRACRPAGMLLTHGSLDLLHEITIGLDGFELRELSYHVWRSPEQQPHMRFRQHRGIVEGIAGCNDVKIKQFQGCDGPLLLLWHP